MNAIGTQLRDSINSGLTRWRMAVQIINGRRRGTPEQAPNLSKHHIHPEYGDEQADAGRD